MQVLHERCAGLDVHKKTVVACVRVVEAGRAKSEVRTFDTTTSALMALAEWLAECGCTHAAMEATGVYWKPIWHVLSDGDLELLLANAAHVKNVPGRKTDVADATWLAELLAHGLIRGSFVPPPEVAELRALMRTRKQLTREKASHVQRLHKTLEDANVKLDSVISNVVGKSGRAMLEAMIAGETEPQRLAALAQPGIRASAATLGEALRGRVQRRHRFLLRLHLDQIDQIDRAIASIDGEVEANLAPFRTAVEQLCSIDGVSRIGAEVIISEIGTDMSRFPTAGHLLSWAGMVPRNDESAGKRRSTRLRYGAPWLKTLLVQCAWAAVRKKESPLKDRFQHLKHRGTKKAICATAADILTAAYHMLKNGTFYEPRRPVSADRTSKEVQAKALIKRLARLGYATKLELVPVPTP